MLGEWTHLRYLVCLTNPVVINFSTYVSINLRYSGPYFRYIPLTRMEFDFKLRLRGLTLAGLRLFRRRRTISRNSLNISSSWFLLRIRFDFRLHRTMYFVIHVPSSERSAYQGQSMGHPHHLASRRQTVWSNTHRSDQGNAIFIVASSDNGKVVIGSDTVNSRVLLTVSLPITMPVNY